MNPFELASLELQREGKDPNNEIELVKRAIAIIEWLRKHGKHVQAIMAGEKIYSYGNKIRTYARA